MLRPLLLMAAFASAMIPPMIMDHIDTLFKELGLLNTNPCIHEALREFIAQCTENGADSVGAGLKRQLAVQLSICEFLEAGVEYPKECKECYSDTDYYSCVQELRNSAQYWTTYSGNYRRLRSVCYEESLPYVKEHIVDLFYNVTKIYSHFQRSAKKAAEESLEFHDAVQMRFHELLEILNLVIYVKSQQEEQMRDDFNSFQAEMVFTQDGMKQGLQAFWHHMGEETETLSAKLNSLQAGFGSMASRADEEMQNTVLRTKDFFSEYSDIFSTLLYSIHLLQETTQESAKSSQRLQNSMEANLGVSSELALSIQEASTEFNDHMSNMESGLPALFETVSQSFELQMGRLAMTIHNEMDRLLSRTQVVSVELEQTFLNVSTAIASIEGEVLLLRYSLSPFIDMFKTLVSVSRLWWKAVALTLFLPLLSLGILTPLRKALRYAFAMLPGFLFAFLLHYLIRLLWSV